MISRAVSITRTESLADELARAHEEIAQRAFEMFQSRGEHDDRALDDWLQAERELFHRPAANLHRTESGVEWLIALPGLAPDDVDVHVAAGMCVVQSAESRALPDDAPVARDRMSIARRIFVAIDLSETPIDPDAARVDFAYGLLRLTAPVARAATMTPTVAA